MEIPKIEISDNPAVEQQRLEKAVKKIREEKKKVQETDPDDNEKSKRGTIDKYV